MARPGTVHKLSNDVLDHVFLVLMDSHEPGNSKLSLTPRELLSRLTSDSLRDILNLRSVNRKFMEVYRLRFSPDPPILRLTRQSLSLERIFTLLLGTTDPDLAGGRYLGFTSNDLSEKLDTESLIDVLNFRLVNKQFNNVYKLRFDPRPPIFRLPTEIKFRILECNIHMSKDLIAPSKKNSLSVESFAVHAQSPEDSDRTANFRLVCKEFADLGSAYQFARVGIRFSPAGFERLYQIASHPHLASRVKQLSYLVPRFYPPQGRVILREIRETLRTVTAELEQQLEKKQRLNENTGPTLKQLYDRLERRRAEELQVTRTISKFGDQERIVDESSDYKALLFALKAFNSLEQIRFMRVVDSVDAGWERFLEKHREYAAVFQPSEWTNACRHGTKTLFLAMLSSGTRVNRLSSRFIDPVLPWEPTQRVQMVLTNVMRYAKSLELELGGPTYSQSDMEKKLLALSDCCRIVFSHIPALQNLHIGFKRRVSMPIEDVFHGNTLENLNYLGLHMWDVTSDELVELLLRHRQVRCLRLRYIQLREGTWAKVLKQIRLNLKLSWVSLRGVGYPQNFEFGGMHHGPLLSDSDDSEPDLSEDEIGDNEGDLHEPHDANDVSDDEADEDEDFSSDERSEDNASALGDAVHGPSTVDGPHTPLSLTVDRIGGCQCHNGYHWSDLEDNGNSVDQRNQGWSRWQEWVLKSCSKHDFDAARVDPEFDWRQL